MSRVAGCLLLAFLALVVTGCGSSSGAATPALSNRLERVDAAAVADDPEALAAAVAGLLRAVEAAESAGDLSSADSDEIRGAAEALLAAADPETPQAPDPTPTPSEPATTSPPPTLEEDDDLQEDDEDDTSPDKDKSQGKGKSKGHDTGHDKDD